MNSDSSHSRPHPHALELNTYEVVFAMQDSLAEEAGLNKSLNFHRFMRHARECHQQLLEFLMRENLLEQTGDCTLVANERKTLIACTQDALFKINALPFVEKTQERPDIAPQERHESRLRPPAHGK